MSARDALLSDVARAKDEAADYSENLDRGADWVGERDDGGHVIWDHADILQLRVDTATDALNALCKAFIISLYHHWERSARRWVGKQNGDHDKLASAVQACNYPIHPKLSAVRDLVNTLKHDRDRWGLALMISWPDLFSPGYLPRATRNDWYEAIHLRGEHVLEAIAVVSESGPTSKS